MPRVVGLYAIEALSSPSALAKARCGGILSGMKHWFWLLLIAVPALAQTKHDAVGAFDRYIAAAEQRTAAEHTSVDPFLRLNSLPAAQRCVFTARLRQGEVMIETVGTTPVDVPARMIHDWVGTAFVPRASVAQVLALVQDYDHVARYYHPDVQASRLIARHE